MKIDDLRKLISEVRNLYKSDFKDYIYKYLTKLSNDNTIISPIDRKIINFRYSYANYEVFKNNIDSGAFDKDQIMYKYDTYAEGRTELRNIFGYSNLTDIMKIIEFIINNEEKICNFDTVSMNSLYNYIDCLIHNVKILAMYFFNEKEDSFDINYGDIIKNEIINDKRGFNIDNFESSLESYSISEEVDETKALDDAKRFRNILKFIGNMVLKIKTILNESSLKIKSFIDKLNVKRTIFYNKNIGRIDHLYKNYGNAAQILENETIDDPVMILNEKVPKYMSRVVNGIIKVYNTYNSHIENLFGSSSFDDMIKKVNSYLTYKEVKLSTDATAKDVNKSLKLDLRYKIASIILKDIDVYGYTVESIITKKYPPFHHLIVSLFLSRPHEKPTEQSVDTIFKSADSFKIMSKKFKDIILGVSMGINKTLSSVNIEQDYKKISSRVTEYKRSIGNKHVNVLNKNIDKSETQNETNTKDLKKRIVVLQNHEHLLQSFIPLFIYIANAGTVVYDIAVRVDRTAQTAIQSMIAIEKSRSDSNQYKTGVDTGNKENKNSKRSKITNVRENVTKTSKIDNGNLVTQFKV